MIFSWHITACANAKNKDNAVIVLKQSQFFYYDFVQAFTDLIYESVDQLPERDFSIGKVLHIHNEEVRIKFQFLS